LNPNVDGPNESEETSVLEELISRRSKDVQKTREELGRDSTIAHSPDMPLDDGQDVAALEEEAQGEGAFNPETGEINWDCPCLGGMAHGPCGPQFREAFSCFVYSTEEPKGMDCIEKFQGMRDCFQEHPEIYKDELMDDEEMDAELEAEKQELVNQIAERRKAEEVAGGDGHRLLEEPVPAAKPSRSVKTTHKEESTPSKSPAAPTSTPTDGVPAASKKEPSKQQSKAAPPPKTTVTKPDPTKAEPATTEGQGSKVNRDASPPPVSEEALPESDELIPKAAHDARSSVGPAGTKPKEE
jgi:mitochondrial intermembrane space import and assembly protein 40